MGQSKAKDNPLDLGYKKIKDPIYGYIEIPTIYMTKIIDTATFQRLRRIIQTSYSPIYSSAVHNRFIHSLGVYHLGTIALNQLKCEIKAKPELREVNLNEIGKIFLIACLLHDVGHAPFSHTGENYYLDMQAAEIKKYDKIHGQLCSLVKSSELKKDIPKAKNAAPHEIMSAILGIKKFKELIGNDLEFFARCITGYRYSDNTGIKNIKNCFIELLNSKVIDVDKLDYLIRDSYFSGFGTVNIDYERLLKALTIYQEDGVYELAYYKGATSIIENVVYAHDLERKWLQSHPVILYECHLLKHIMLFLNEQLQTDNAQLFSLKTIGEKGDKLKNDINLKLLSDDDIIYLAKNYFYDNEACKEYFDRSLRMHPLWKSEAEYKALVRNKYGKGSAVKNFEKAMEDIAQYIAKNCNSNVINKELCDKLRKDIEGYKSKSDPNEQFGDETDAYYIQEKEHILRIVEGMLSGHRNKEFVILSTDEFYSGFSKEDLKKIKILFPDVNGYSPATFESVVASIQAIETSDSSIYYLFYRASKNYRINKAKIISDFVHTFENGME